MRPICWVSSLLLISVAIEAKTLFFEAKDNAICPDKQGSCPDGTTCCQLASGKFGCCPFPNAVCCSDHEHCCPSGFACDVPHQKCVQNDGESVDWATKLDVVPLRENSNDVVCPDKQSHCNDGQTCCQLVSGQWGCCPYPQAVCCSDHATCCPNGYTCDETAQLCVKGNGESLPWSPKRKALQISRLRATVICPDQKSQCDNGQTCCLLASGQYGCCPYPQAVCCSDHEHCCPNGYTCDVPHQQCLKGNGESISWSSKTKAIQIKDSKSVNVVCPDQQTQCPDETTCCIFASGHYGCCPYPQADCCSDHEHCCPNGYTCDVPHQQCLKGNGESISWSSKTKAIQIKDSKSVNVVCPDQQTQCPDGTTCCLLASGQYGCCPYPQAVCCSDHEHCCPNGYTCDVPHQQCLKGNGDIVAWSSKTKATPISTISNSVICPDGKSMCGDGQTCCQLASGIWACCSLPKAVCCDDHEHCCPNGYTCDVAEQKCTKASRETLSWSKNLDSTQISKKNETPKKQDENLACPDGSSCSEDETCCLISATAYGCCPLPQATCCSDFLHCCPHAYKCDVQKETCIRSDGLEVPWTKKSPPKSDPSTDPSLCADQKSKCRDGFTCCSNSAVGSRGCCPYENSVCCSDGLHCCPENTVCDADTQMCQSNKINMAISWNTLEKLIGGSGFSSVKTNEKCPDQKSECPTETTCCQMQSGLYGCCPFKQALCCEDKLHCCPSGFKCDVEHSRCVAEKSGVALPWEMFGRRRAKTIL